MHLAQLPVLAIALLVSTTSAVPSPPGGYSGPPDAFPRHPDSWQGPPGAFPSRPAAYWSPPAASPTGRPWCLSAADAEQIGDDFASLISAYNATFANLVLADDYTDQSDSVNTLIDSGTDAPLPVSILPFDLCHT